MKICIFYSSKIDFFSLSFVCNLALKLLSSNQGRTQDFFNFFPIFSKRVKNLKTFLTCRSHLVSYYHFLKLFDFDLEKNLFLKNEFFCKFHYTPQKFFRTFFLKIFFLFYTCRFHSPMIPHR